MLAVLCPRLGGFFILSLCLLLGGISLLLCFLSGQRRFLLGGLLRVVLRGAGVAHAGVGGTTLVAEDRLLSPLPGLLLRLGCLFLVLRLSAACSLLLVGGRSTIGCFLLLWLGGCLLRCCLLVLLFLLLRGGLGLFRLFLLHGLGGGGDALVLGLAGFLLCDCRGGFHCSGVAFAGCLLGQGL